MPNTTTAAQVARLREMAEESAHRAGYEPSPEAELLTAAADALDREAWCEEREVDVSYIGTQSRWMVVSCDAQPWRRRYHHGKTRNAAIDAARGAK